MQFDGHAIRDAVGQILKVFDFEKGGHTNTIVLARIHAAVHEIANNNSHPYITEKNGRIADWADELFSARGHIKHKGNSSTGDGAGVLRGYISQACNSILQQVEYLERIGYESDC